MEECTPQWPSFVTGGPDNAHQETLEIRRKKNKVDICIYGFGEKITNKKRNGSVFHTVWSYWLNTRVRIVRLKRKKMRVFFLLSISSFLFLFSYYYCLRDQREVATVIHTRTADASQHPPSSPLRFPYNETNPPRRRRRRRECALQTTKLNEPSESEGLGQLFSPVSKRQAY